MLAVGNFRSLETHTKDGAADMTALAKWRILNRLHDRNETLYYKVFCVPLSPCLKRQVHEKSNCHMYDVFHAVGVVL
jgi:hypothetical protein